MSTGMHRGDDNSEGGRFAPSRNNTWLPPRNGYRLSQSAAQPRCGCPIGAAPRADWMCGTIGYSRHIQYRCKVDHDYQILATQFRYRLCNSLCTYLYATSRTTQGKVPYDRRIFFFQVIRVTALSMGFRYLLSTPVSNSSFSFQQATCDPGAGCRAASMWNRYQRGSLQAIRYFVDVYRNASPRLPFESRYYHLGT